MKRLLLTGLSLVLLWTMSLPCSAQSGNGRSAAALSLYSDIKARRVGDVVTVLVVEKASASKSSNTQTKRSSNKQGSLSALPIPANTWLKKRFDLLNEGVKLGGESSYSGGGSTSRTETLQAEVSALVQEVLPNGNLVIDGNRTITVNGETQLISVKGIVRPEDIRADNTIYSMFLVNPEITYTGKGILSNQKPGWLSRFLDWVWPF